jgi:hypothetical protein
MNEQIYNLGVTLCDSQALALPAGPGIRVGSNFRTFSLPTERLVTISQIANLKSHERS